MIPQTVRKKAFTLTELLFVIAVIGILVAILMPAVNSLRRSANQAHGAVNMRQLGVALNLFTNDHQGQIPAWMTVIGDVDPSVATNQDKLFFWQVLPYLNDVDVGATALEKVDAGRIYKELNSPGVPEDYGYRINVGDDYYTVQFAVNKALDKSIYAGPDGNGLSRPTRLTDLIAPEKTAWLTVGAGSFVESSGQNPSFELPDSSVIPGWTERIWFPYSRKTNILFIDGHVESRAAPLDQDILNPWRNGGN
jgi:prepilin-type N-terminal cleavage/methylation domain-containing protein/prepilin-type processing-associated H-X9-DG protein